MTDFIAAISYRTWRPQKLKEGAWAFARPGDDIRCEKGHSIATVILPLAIGSTISVKAFKWHVDAPIPGDPIKGKFPCRCPFCDTQWARTCQGKNQIHVNGRWLP